MNANSPPRRSAEEQARFETGVVRIFESDIRFNQVLGLKVLSVNAGELIATGAASYIVS